MIVAAKRSVDAVLDLLSVRTGLSFPDVRRTDAENAVHTLIAESRCDSVEEYLARIETDAREFDQLIDRVTVGETYFFREPGQLEWVREHVLRDYIGQRDPGCLVRVWSAGCATGEEAYSLAILLEQEQLLSRSRILATDLSRGALERARSGAYGKWSFRNPELMLDPYFIRQGTTATIAPHLRHAIDFEMLNLALDLYPSPSNGTSAMDLILCRNVLIYLDGETIRAAAEKLFACLVDGGFLVTAPSDPLLSDYAPFETLLTPSGLIYRRSAVVPERARAIADNPEPAAPARTPLPVVETRTEEEPPKESEESLVAKIREMANDADPISAERAASAAVGRFPLSIELRLLHALLLIGAGRHEDAAAGLRRVIFLDGSLAIAHFLLATALQRLGDLEGARRSYRNAHQLCRARDAAEIVPLSDGESAGFLAECAAAHLAHLDEFAARRKT